MYIFYTFLCEQELGQLRRRVHDAVYQRVRGRNLDIVLLAEPRLQLEHCQLSDLPATCSKPQATWFKE